jgi:hypothetical protein
MPPTALTFHGRLPGVVCDPAVPPREQPIRLDVAAFVGLAERGPVDTPVLLVEPAGFATVFGADYVLATDGGKPVYAQLPSAVKAFFDNGGRRCYAVRVAGPGANPSRWAVPGLEIWQPDGSTSPVLVEAAWPGRWSAETEVSVEPIARPIASGVAYQRAGSGSDPGEPGQLMLPSAATASVHPGDLLQLNLGPSLPGLYVRAAAAAAGLVLTDRELAYDLGPAADISRLPSVLPVAAVTLLRMDLVVHQRTEGELQLVERFNDLAYATWSSVLQPPGDPIPDLSRSVNLRADTATEQLARTGLVVPSTIAGAVLAIGTDDLSTFEPLLAFVDERLGSDTVFSLPANADTLTSLATDPARLRGIHSLLGVDEVAMIACPDLTQRSWSQLPAPAGDPEPEPVAPPPPDWSDFRSCAVETAPPPTAPEPEPVVTPPLAPVQLDPVATYDDGPMLAVQQALVTMCAARADMVALLSVPQHYDVPALLDWHQQLTSASTLAGSVTSALTPLSYAAYWHPWLQVSEPAAPLLDPLRRVPPDGAVAGMVAARELARGIWVAPTAVGLRGPVALAARSGGTTVGALTETETVRLFDAHANVIRQRPGSFAAISAHTLAEGELLQLSVRRMLIWLRKVALRAGQRYTFEVNNERFRQLVQRRFERILADLTARGAFHAFRVVTDAGVNTADDIDNGRLIVALQVAPSSPVEFITINLLRTGEGLLDVWEA